MKPDYCGFDSRQSFLKGNDMTTIQQLKEQVHSEVGYHGGLCIQEMIDDLAKQIPQWHKRPTGPGLWICWADDQSGRFVTAPILRLTAEDIARGSPFRTICVYGPIPEPPAELLKGN